ncbi:hypothetical protein LOC54_09365 [Acetobacter sp. AN02]|uniref:hypothetical protein n=1 Tax=Acetobacter sp. AN02 TaxID=2894186 RepID=UPI00243414CF|nr:hypothetical protein [Acetobacter sp. AN02]MDG6095308.1 hypothetical protein [Acetobacter sp. AN02]
MSLISAFILLLVLLALSGSSAGLLLSGGAMGVMLAGAGHALPAAHAASQAVLYAAAFLILLMSSCAALCAMRFSSAESELRKGAPVLFALPVIFAATLIFVPSQGEIFFSVRLTGLLVFFAGLAGGLVTETAVRQVMALIVLLCGIMMVISVSLPLRGSAPVAAICLAAALLATWFLGRLSLRREALDEDSFGDGAAS